MTVIQYTADDNRLRPFSQARDAGLVTEPPGLPVLRMRLEPVYTFEPRAAGRPPVTAGAPEEFGPTKKKRKRDKKEKAKTGSADSSGSSTGSES